MLSYQETQFTSYASAEKPFNARPVPSFDSIGDILDKALVESCWSSVQHLLLARKPWTVRVELSNAVSDYIEVFYDRRRRPSKPGYVSPIKYRHLLDKCTA